MKINIRYKISLIYLYLYIFIGNMAYAQSDSLPDYLKLAAQNNPGVLQKFSEYQAALQKIPQVGSLPDPEISVGVFLSPMELIGGKQIADIRLMQMFPWFGVLKNATDEMSLMAKAKYELLRDAKLQVFFDVQSTWFEMQKIKQNINISEKNLAILQTIERLTLVKFRATPLGNNNPIPSAGIIINNSSQNTTPGASGMNSMGGSSGNNPAANNGSQPSAMQSSSMGSSASGGSGLVDIYRIQIEIGELNNNIALLKTQQSTILARFNNYINRPVKSPILLPEILKSDTLETSLLAISDSMLTNSPMLAMLQYEQQSFDARKKMVTRMSYPMIGIGLNYSLINKNEMSTSTMNGTDMIMPMVTITLPIYRRKYKAMQTEADLLKSASVQSYNASSNSLQTEYYEALQAYQDAKRRISLFDNQSQLANKSLDIMIQSYSASRFNLTDILRIQQQTLDYELKKIEAISDFNISIAWLKRLGNCSIKE